MLYRLLMLIVFALVSVPARSLCEPAESIIRPNVILILADDMALGDLASLNGGISRTPNLDRLKSESVWFSQARSASPVCAPARAALLTGRYPHRTGVVSLNMEKHPEFTRLHADERTVADRFRDNGYVTGMIGKWHLGIGDGYHPLDRGFDECAAFLGHLYAPSYFDFTLDLQSETTKFPEGRYLTEELSDRAIDFIRRQNKNQKPFFLHLAHYAPHRPIEAPAERIKPYSDAGLDAETATIYAMIEIMDDGIGALLGELDKLEVSEHTIVLFASDNGPDPMAGPERFNLGLRGTKYMVNEGGIRVPFMVRWPAKITPDERSDTVHFTDVLPTLIELCELKTEAGLPLDGVSFAAALKGGQISLPGQRFWQWNRAGPRYSHNAAVCEGNWKLVRPFVTKNYPEADSDRPAQLYDLSIDPGESDDRASRQPDRTARLNRALEDWCRQIEADRMRVPTKKAGE